MGRESSISIVPSSSSGPLRHFYLTCSCVAVTLVALSMTSASSAASVDDVIPSSGISDDTGLSALGASSDYLLSAPSLAAATGQDAAAASDEEDDDDFVRRLRHNLELAQFRQYLMVINLLPIWQHCLRQFVNNIILYTFLWLSPFWHYH